MRAAIGAFPTTVDGTARPKPMIPAVRRRERGSAMTGARASSDSVIDVLRDGCRAWPAFARLSDGSVDARGGGEIT
jgi:hypothetical protein